MFWRWSVAAMYTASKLQHGCCALMKVRDSEGPNQWHALWALRFEHPGGYGYSRFYELFRSFERRLSPTMRQEHVAGDKVFVDYSGKKIAVVDPRTGEIREAELFIAVFGASRFTYAEATWTQALPDWIGAHVRMFRFFGGVPRLVVPDNPNSGDNRASFYDSEINRSYGMMASHSGVGYHHRRSPPAPAAAVSDPRPGSPAPSASDPTPNNRHAAPMLVPHLSPCRVRQRIRLSRPRESPW
jgi:hypothetical protein